jgi:hypothetical protein
MTANYVLLERITVGAAGASSVSFNNIPQTGYTDLKVVGSARSTTSSQVAEALLVTFNTGGTYSSKYLQGVGSGTPASGSFAQFAGQIADPGATTNTFSNFEIYIPNYTSSNQKSYLVDTVSENNATTGYTTLIAGLWSGTAAITTLSLSRNTGGNFAQYSTFSLYALAAVGTTPTKAPKAIGGDIIQTDGTYWYHAFLSSGSFTPQTALSCDVLVVAGGGGTQNNVSNGQAGGGGAGGVLAFASQSLIANTSNLVTVGAGGAGSNGSNSQFASLTASVGGGLGTSYTTAPSTGGSGGGSGTNTTAGAAGTAGQGNSGGTGSAPAGGQVTGGGGGGAGHAGYNSSGMTAGNGGDGVNTVTNWGALSSALTTLGLGVGGYIAGGGGGGAFSTSSTSYSVGTGTGGGGNGGYYINSSIGNGTNAAPNTGGGGGGTCYSNTTGSSGGSGLVIVRYAY